MRRPVPPLALGRHAWLWASVAFFAVSGLRCHGGGKAELQSRHPADPGRELLCLPRAGQCLAQGRPAARPARSGRQGGGHRAGQAGRERDDPPHLRHRQGRSDAAAVDPQAAHRGPEGDSSRLGSPPGPSTSRSGRSSRPRGPPCRRSTTAGWVRNPIDRFVLAALEQRGLQPAPEADRRTWPGG